MYDEIDTREIFDMLREIRDPEHPHTLEELNVVQEELINCSDKENFVDVSTRFILLTSTPPLDMGI